MRKNFGIIIICSMLVCSVIAWFAFLIMLMADPAEGSIFETWYWFLILKAVGVVGLITMSAIIGYVYECIHNNIDKL